MNGTTMVYARYLAVQLVKQQLAEAGIRFQTVERRGLTQLANEYMTQHPALLGLAAEQVQAIPDLKKISDREDRRRSVQSLTNLRTLAPGEPRK